MRSCVAVVLALLVVAVAPGVARAADWVGLGDSYAAGPLIPSQSLNPLGCLRSSRNYARIAAANRGMSLADVSCSGAKTTHMTAAQSTDAGTNPPQFNALSAATKVVSLQIGGNDIGFTEILQNCVTYNPFTHPCKDRYNSGGTDQIQARIDATAPKVAAAIQGIHALAPSAKVLVVNYAAILPESGNGCWPQVPLAYADVPYLRAKQKALNAMLQTAAAGNGAIYVDDYTASIGKDACRSSGTRWVEPLVPQNAAAPFHPNARGEAGVAVVVTAASNL
jgi:GDSL-like lipase/acylhydrolase family protein